MASTNSGGTSNEQFWEGATSPKPPKKRSILKIIGILAAVLVVALVVLVALLPTIAGSMAPGFIESAAKDSIAGGVKVDKASFSWGGPQTIGDITLLDPKGTAASNQVARVKVEISSGLFTLMTAASGKDVGVITVSGQASLTRFADGTTNLDRALEPKVQGAGKPANQPATPASSGGAAPSSTLPPSLKAKLLIDKFDLTYRDEGAQTGEVKVSDVKGEAEIGPAQGGTAALLKLAATTSGGGSTGSININGRVDGLADASGKLAPTTAKIDATIDIKNAPLAVADALAGMGGRLAKGVGPTLDASIVVKGNAKNADALVKATAAHVNADLTLNIADNVLTASKPGVIKIDGSAIRTLAPQIDESLAKSGTVTLTSVPDVSVSLDALKIKIPEGGAADLRGGAVQLTLAAGETIGTIKLDPNAAPSALRVAPLALRVEAPDLGGTVKVSAKTDARIGNQNAGVLTLDAVASGLLDDKGAPVKGAPGALDAKLLLQGVATAIAQPFVQSAKLDLPKDIGPTLDVDVRAKTAAANAVDLTFGVTSANVKAAGALAYDGTSLKSAKDGVRVSLAQVGQLAGRFVADSGASIAPRGTATLSITDLDLPLHEKSRQPLIDKSKASLRVDLDGLSMTPAKGAGAVDIAKVTLAAGLSPGKAPRVDLNSSMNYAGKPFAATGAFDVPGLLSNKADGTLDVNPGGARPVGQLDLRDVPTAIAGLAPSKPGADGKPGLDLAKLMNEVVGPTLNVNVKGGAESADAVALTVAANGQNLKAGTQAKLAKDAIAIAATSVETTLAPSTLATLMAMFAPDLKDGPTLVNPAKITLGVKPLSIPMGSDGKPDFARAGEFELSLNMPGQTIAQGFKLKQENGGVRDMGQIGVEDMALLVKAPGSLLGSSDAAWTKPLAADFSMKILTGPGAVSGVVTGKATGDLTSSKGQVSVGNLDAVAKIADLRNDKLDGFLAQPGLLVGALGPTTSVDANVKIRPAAGGQTIDAEIAVLSPKMKFDGPMKLAVLPDRIKSDREVKINWQLDPEFANAHVFKPDASGKAMTLLAPAPVSLTLGKFAISKGADPTQPVGPLKPGVFELAMNAIIPSLDLTLPDGQRMKLGNTRVTLTTPPAADAASAIAFNVAVESVEAPGTAQAGKPAAAQKISLVGNVSNLADKSGNVNADAATLTANGDMPVVPTALVDALAQQNGLLVDALGPTTSVSLRAENFSKTGGSLSLEAGSERAKAKVKGNSGAGVFAISEPLNISIIEVTQALASRFVTGMPLVGSIEKLKTDQPATIVASALRVPLDSDMAKLNGQIQIDPGQAKFTASEQFGPILNLAAQKTMASVGNKLEPMSITITNGVAEYAPWALPLGEFKLATEGKVDLVQKKVDVITWIPLGALSEETAKLVSKANLGGVLGDILGGKKEQDKKKNDGLMIPFRTKGSFGKAKTEPDLELLAKQAIDNAKPEDLLQKGLDSIFKKKGK